MRWEAQPGTPAVPQGGKAPGVEPGNCRPQSGDWQGQEVAADGSSADLIPVRSRNHPKGKEGKKGGRGEKTKTGRRAECCTGYRNRGLVSRASFSPEYRYLGRMRLGKINRYEFKFQLVFELIPRLQNRIT